MAKPTLKAARAKTRGPKLKTKKAGKGNRHPAAVPFKQKQSKGAVNPPKGLKAFRTGPQKP